MRTRRLTDCTNLLEYTFYYSVGEGMVAISDEILLAYQEVMVVVQLPKLHQMHSMTVI